MPASGIHFGAILSLSPQDVKDDYGWTVLMWAALAGSIDICDAWTAHFSGR